MNPSDLVLGELSIRRYLSHVPGKRRCMEHRSSSLPIPLPDGRVPLASDATIGQVEMAIPTPARTAPDRAAVQPPPSPRESRVRRARGAEARPTIFILHHDQWISDLLREFFRDHDTSVAVRPVSSASQIPSILAIEAASPALLIVAKELRVGGGANAIRSAKQLGLSSMPVVYLTQNRLSADEAAARAAGADLVLEFPTIASEISPLTVQIHTLLRSSGSDQAIDSLPIASR
jgi:CheY-like chemotaxis protein